ncbi:hypothetical protein YB2330_002677 [Saitoella coloradoensis]
MARLNYSIFRFIPFHPRYLFWVIIIVAVILMSLLTGGCTNNIPAIKSLFLVQLEYDTGISNNTIAKAATLVLGESDLKIKVGFFGTCIVGNTTECSTNINSLINSTAIQAAGFEDSLGMLDLVHSYLPIYPQFIIISILLAFLSLPISYFWTHVATYFQCLAAVFAGLEVFVLHIEISSLSMIDEVSFGVLQAKGGFAALVVQWFAFIGLLVVFAGNWLIMRMEQRIMRFGVKLGDAV